MITVISAVSAVTIGLLFTNAHNSPLDELGCHRDPPGSHYHCHTGFLKGKEFGDKEEARRALASVSASGADFSVTYEDTPEAAAEKQLHADANGLPPPPEQPKAVMNEKMLKIISWNVRKRSKVDYDRIVSVLTEADVAVLQDLDLDEKGKGPLHIIGDLWQLRTGEKICRMWFKNNAQGRERYGVLWRTATISYVNQSGEVKDSCGEMAVVVPTNKAKTDKLLASAQFFSKVQKKMFQLGTVFLDNKPALKDVQNLFKPLESSTWPTIVVGDVKYPAYELKKWEFKSNIAKGATTAKKNRGSKYSSGNVWSRNAVVVRAIHINLYDRFAELTTPEIENSVSSSFPMLAEVALTKEVNDHLATLIIKAKKEQTAPVKKEPKSKPERPAPKNFEEPKDDIEAEANLAETDDNRSPASNKSKKKKR